VKWCCRGGSARPAEFWRLFGELEPEPVAVVFEPPTAGAGSRTCWLMPASRPTWPPAGHRGDRGRPGHQRPVDAKPWPSCWDQPAGRGLDRPTGGPGGPPAGPHPGRPGRDALPGAIPAACPAGRPGHHPRADHPVRPGRAPLDAGLRLLDAITVEINHTDADLRACFADDHRVRRRLPIPGHRAGDRGHRGRRGLDLQRYPAPARLGPGPDSPQGSAPATPRPAAATSPNRLPLAPLDAARGRHQRRPRPHLGRFTTQIAQRHGPQIPG
jgi:hypothetical protein